jgi:hypothetical protein
MKRFKVEYNTFYTFEKLIAHTLILKYYISFFKQCSRDTVFFFWVSLTHNCRD